MKKQTYEKPRNPVDRHMRALMRRAVVGDKRAKLRERVSQRELAG